MDRHSAVWRRVPQLLECLEVRQGPPGRYELELLCADAVLRLRTAFQRLLDLYTLAASAADSRAQHIVQCRRDAHTSLICAAPNTRKYLQDGGARGQREDDAGRQRSLSESDTNDGKFSEKQGRHQHDPLGSCCSACPLTLVRPPRTSTSTTSCACPPGLALSVILRTFLHHDALGLFPLLARPEAFRANFSFKRCSPPLS